VSANKLETALWSIEVPGSAPAEDRAVDQARDRFGGRVEAPRGGSLPWVRIGIATAALVLVASFTPPGQTALGWVAGLVGVGDVGGTPIVHEFRELAPGARATVIAAGRAPDGRRFEVVSYRGSGTGFLPRLRGEYSRICVDINLIRPNRAVSGHCAVLPPRGVVTIQSSTTGLGLGPHAASTIEGTVPRRTARVVIREWSGAPVRLASPINAVVAPVREPLVTRIDASRPFNYYVGFLPQGVHPQDVRVVALDRAGDVIGRDRLHGGRATYRGAYAPGTTNYLQERDLRRGRAPESGRGPGSHGG
jgi:hypothetical protein